MHRLSANRGFGVCGGLAVALLLAVGTLVEPRPTVGATAQSASCPPPPVTIATIAQIGEERASACFGRTALSFIAYVPPHPYGIGDPPNHHISPAWLDGLAGSFVMLTAGPEAGVLVIAFVPPGLGACDGSRIVSTCPFRSYHGRWARITAHFDGPVAQTCRVVSHDPAVTFTDAQAVAQCRTALIVLSVGPVNAPATDTLAASPDRPIAGPGVALTIAAMALALLAIRGMLHASRPRSGARK